DVLLRELLEFIFCAGFDFNRRDIPVATGTQVQLVRAMAQIGLQLCNCHPTSHMRLLRLANKIGVLQVGFYRLSKRLHALLNVGIAVEHADAHEVRLIAGYRGGGHKVKISIGSVNRLDHLVHERIVIGRATEFDVLAIEQNVLWQMEELERSAASARLPTNSTIRPRTSIFLITGSLA